MGRFHGRNSRGSTGIGRRATYASGAAFVAAGLLLTVLAPAVQASPAPAITTPTLTTALSATSISAGGSVYDTATLANFAVGSGVAGGSLSYYDYPGSGACPSAQAVLVGVVAVSPTGSVPNSASLTFNTAGVDSWDAVYAGNSLNGPTVSPCEPLTVNALAAVNITTSLSPSSIPAGGSVLDTSTLFGATPTASGTVTYVYFTAPGCSGTPVLVSVVTVTAGSVPNSASVTFPTAGAYSWQATYSGDANNSNAVSACEHLTVGQANPAITTSLNVTTNQTIGPTIPIPLANNVLAPYAVAYDAANGYLYATLTDANAVAVVNGATDTYLLSISVGAYPWGITYDAYNHEVYVVNNNGGNPGATVSVILGTGVMATVPVATGAQDAAYDATNGDVYVLSDGLVSLICDGSPACGGATHTNQVVATVAIPSGGYDSGITYDPANGRVYAPGNSIVYVLAGASIYTTIAITSGAILGTGTYDASDGYIYFVQNILSDLVVVDPATNAQVTTLSLPLFWNGPWGATYDAYDGQVYVSNEIAGFGLGRMYVVSGLSVVGLLPVIGTAGIAYDAATHSVYAGQRTGVGQLDLVRIGPGYRAVDSATLSGATSNAGGSVTYEYFAGTSCSGSPTSVATVTVTSGLVPNSPPELFVSTSYSWRAIYSGDTNNLGATSPCETMSVPFHVIVIPPFLTHVLVVNWGPAVNVLATLPSQEQVGFAADGTPIRGVGNATLFGAPGLGGFLTVPGPLPGGYTLQVFGVANDSLSGAAYAVFVAAAGGNWTHGNASVAFRKLPGDIDRYGAARTALALSSGGRLTVAPRAYNVTFSETGLPAKSLASKGWSVALNGSLRHSTGPTITFQEPGGSYSALVAGPDGYVVKTCAPCSPGWPSHPHISVSGDAAVNLTFGKGHTLGLSFRKEGDLGPRVWCVEVNNVSRCSSASAVEFTNLTPGRYDYGVVGPGRNFSVRLGKLAEPSSGSINLTKNAKLVVTFLYRYALTLSETGLTSGTWSVSVKGTTETAAWNQSIVYELANGTYSAKVRALSGYTSSLSAKKVAIEGAAAEDSVTFTAKAVPHPSLWIVGLPLPGLAALTTRARRSAEARTSPPRAPRPGGRRR